MATSGRRFRRRKVEDVFCEGYFIDHAFDVMPSFEETDETFHIYGQNSPDTDKQINVGRLQISVYDKFTNNAILDLATGNDPGVGITVVRQYRVPDLAAISVWGNVKNQAQSAYVKSYFVPNWTPGLPMPSGGANDKAQFQFNGQAGLPQMFENAWITGKKVASSALMAVGATPVELPKQTNIFAIRIMAINDLTGSGGAFETEDIAPTNAMFPNTGILSIADIGPAVTSLATVSHVYVNYLQTGTGIYPTVIGTSARLRT